MMYLHRNFWLDPRDPEYDDSVNEEEAREYAEAMAEMNEDDRRGGD